MTPPRSTTHLVLIPSYDTGALRLLATVAEARRFWSPITVVIDGSRDGSGEALRRQLDASGDLRLLELPRNEGKGAAILHGLRDARARGFTHALTMDADGQHPAASIPSFMAASFRHAGAMILAIPRFGAEAPQLRVQGRRISNFWVDLETLGGGIGDSLCGFRVYPIEDLLAVAAETPWMRRFDFDAEAAVRLFWRGIEPINLPAPVVYLDRAEGGVSHFRYGRDNALLIWMHTRLVFGAVARLPRLLRRWRQTRAAV